MCGCPLVTCQEQVGAIPAGVVSSREKRERGKHLVLHEGEERRDDDRDAHRQHRWQLIAKALACTATAALQVFRSALVVPVLEHILYALASTSLCCLVKQPTSRTWLGRCLAKRAGHGAHLHLSA